MGLLDFVKFADSFKVKTRERKLVKGEVPLITKTADVVVAPSAQTVCLMDHTIINELEEHAGKKKRKVSGCFEEAELQSGPQGNKSRSAPHATEEFMSSSVTLTPKLDVPKDSGSTQDVNVQTRRVPKRVIVATSSFEHGDTDVSLRVKSLLSHIEAKNIDARFTDRAGASSIPGDNAGTSTSTPNEGSHVENPILCRNLLDHITPPGYWAALRNQTDARFLDGFNINSAQHACMVSKLRLRYDHEIMSRERFQKKFTKSFVVIQQRDAKIVVLKAKLGITEKESAEVSGLRKRASDLEAAVATKASEVVTLIVQNAELLVKFFALELIREELNGKLSQLTTNYDSLRSEVVGEAKMREEFVSQQDAAAWRFEERVVGLDARITEVKHDMDTDLYPHMLTVISRRRWVLGHGVRLTVMKCAQSFECHSALGKVISLAINKGSRQGLEAGVEHGKAGRVLAQVKAYDPDVENKYVATVKDFDNGDHGDVDPPSEFLKLQPVSSQVTLPVYSKTGSLIGIGFISGEILLSNAIVTLCVRAEKKKVSVPSSVTIGGPYQDNSFAITDYHISTLALNNDAVTVAQPHDDLFDTTAVDKHVEL
ncbi:hypothetical protein Tco_1116783, partial [Tanacetum coccineum]